LRPNLIRAQLLQSLSRLMISSVPETWQWAVARLVRYRHLVFRLLALSAGEVLLRLSAPWALKTTVDHVFTGLAAPRWLEMLANAAFGWCADSPKAALLMAIGAIGLLAHVSHQGVMWLHTRFHAILAQTLTRDLRNDLFWHVQCLALAHHTKNPPADAVYRLSADATCLEQLMLRAAIPALSSLATLGTMFVILASINVWLALASLAVIPGLWLSLRAHSRRVAGQASRVKALESRAMEHAQESLSVIRLVKTFARERFERTRFSDATHEATQARLELTRREARFSFIVGVLTTLGTTLVLVVGGSMVIAGTITQGTLLLVLAYLGFIYGPLTAMSASTAIVREAVASVERVRDVMAIAPEPVGSGVRKSPRRRLRGEIRVEGVCFGYSEHATVLHDVSFAVAPGEFVAVVGPSGSGKTTITSLLTRLYEPTRGRILIDGIDTRDYTLHELREQISVVVQDAVLVSGSVRENLRYGRLDATESEIVQAARDAGAHDFICTLPDGYQTAIGTAGSRLSGGQRQRLSIARAFLKNAPVLVLDEPTSALDTVSEARLVQTLERLGRGRTTIVIAHRLSTVRRADRILVLDAGRIVASGTHAELLRSSELYATLAGELADDTLSADDAPPTPMSACA
jgi:ABC-type multidrug transport system fused ATPase/permease subunit